MSCNVIRENKNLAKKFDFQQDIIVISEYAFSSS